MGHNPVYDIYVAIISALVATLAVYFVDKSDILIKNLAIFGIKLADADTSTSSKIRRIFLALLYTFILFSIANLFLLLIFGLPIFQALENMRAFEVILAVVAPFLVLAVIAVLLSQTKR